METTATSTKPISGAQWTPAPVLSWKPEVYIATIPQPKGMEPRDFLCALLHTEWVITQDSEHLPIEHYCAFESMESLIDHAVKAGPYNWEAIANCQTAVAKDLSLWFRIHGLQSPKIPASFLNHVFRASQSDGAPAQVTFSQGLLRSGWHDMNAYVSMLKAAWSLHDRAFAQEISRIANAIAAIKHPRSQEGVACSISFARDATKRFWRSTIASPLPEVRACLKKVCPDIHDAEGETAPTIH